MTARFTDTTLTAWLDGELPPEQRADVEDWLREHPEDAARVRLWAADGEALRARLDPVLAEAVPERLAQLVLNAQPGSTAAASAGWPGWQRWAAALAVFVLGGATGAALMWRAQPEARVAGTAYNGGGWVQRAAVAHSVYVPEVRHAVEVKAQEEHLSRWLTRRLDVPVKLFDLRAQGFELVGGRLLPDASGPSAQLMYQAISPVGAAVSGAGVSGSAVSVSGAPVVGAAGATASGATASGGVPGAGASAAVVPAVAKPLRVTVYLRKPDDNTPAEFRYEQRGELGMFYWVEGQSAHGKPTGYALVGALPREKLLALAEAIYRQGTAQSP
jgi:anti-sigma factor RsiW